MQAVENSPAKGYPWIYIGIFGLILVIIIGVIWSLIIERRDRQWEERMRGLGSYIGPQLPASNWHPASHKAYEVSAWNGLRHGTVLGFGYGLITWVGVILHCKPELLLLTLIVWWFLLGQRGNGDRGSPYRVSRDDELEVYSIQATLFCIVFGILLAFIGAAGSTYHWRLEWVLVLSLLWTLLWGTYGQSATWSKHNRAAQLIWVSTGWLEWGPIWRYCYPAKRLYVQAAMLCIVTAQWSWTQLWGVNVRVQFPPLPPIEQEADAFAARSTPEQTRLDNAVRASLSSYRSESVESDSSNPTLAPQSPVPPPIEEAPLPRLRPRNPA